MNDPEPLATIPFGDTDGHIVIKARVGAAELDLVLDTGMSAPVLFLNRAELRARLGLSGGESVMIGGAGGGEPRRGTVFAGVPTSLGGLELGNQTVCMPDDDDGHLPGFDGVIGKGIFDRWVVGIDFDGRTISLFDPSGFGDADGEADGDWIPLSFKNGIPKVPVTVTMADGRELPLDLVMDLGARHAVSLDAGGSGRIEPPAEYVETVVGRGVQGGVRGKVSRIAGLAVGGFRFAGVVGSFVEADAMAGGSALGADGNLGLGILGRFRILVDYPRKRLRLVPGARFAEPFEHDMSGLCLARLDNRSWLVLDVVEGSPGKEAGVLHGDRLVGLDGRDAASWGSAEAADALRTPGREALLLLERDGARVEVALRLRRLV